MKKVVYNRCFGGFGLSAQAMVYLLMMGFPLGKTEVARSGFKEEDFTLFGPQGIRAHPYFSVVYLDGFVYDIEKRDNYELRSHPVLVAVVERLGEAANSDCAELEIAELNDYELYRIKEYDGRETVEVFDNPDYYFGHLMTEVAFPAANQMMSPDGLLLLTDKNG